MKCRRKGCDQAPGN